MALIRWKILWPCLLPLAAWASEVSLVGTLGSKALLSINGGTPSTMQVGQSAQGVRLLSVQGGQAIVEIDSKRRTLKVGQHAGSVTDTASGGGSGASSVTLIANGAGQFFTNGMINGTSVRFIVDTGATFVSIGASDARRIGLDTSGGQRGMSHTANGQVQVTKIRLNTVKVGEVTLHNVDALVHENDLPVTLLGMSFLNRMEMQHQGSTMVLKKRF